MQMAAACNTVLPRALDTGPSLSHVRLARQLSRLTGKLLSSFRLKLADHHMHTEIAHADAIPNTVTWIDPRPPGHMIWCSAV